MRALIHTFRSTTLDITILRLSVCLIFFTFGMTKWFDFEVEILKPMISPTWLNFLYEWLGYHGTSYFLGVVEGIAYIALAVGYWKPRWGIIGSMTVLLVSSVTLSMLLQLGFNSFIFKDILLIGAGLVLLKYDLNRLYSHE
ncbi:MULTISPECIES: DUF417 family protein [unclassified Moraxella]|uniref:DUF417 family protein n=1 Tax=unclassified Moraxella TaxID=2685852 RepID=UPI00359D8405